MQQLTPQEIEVFQTKILTWFSKNKRDLPWRQTRDSYKILISEVMSQQTQITRVISKYHAWLEAFPTIEHLANAKASEVLKLWSGLGYNRRALYVQKVAKEIVTKYKSIFPHDEKTLRQLPGIGEYTARAILCFAFNKQIAVVDTNVRKVILTQIKGTTEKDIQTIADQLVPQGKAYEWNQALMDYASAMLKKEKIPISKQSKFVGSDRYYRGQIIKMLLEMKKIDIEKLRALLRCERDRFQRIIDKLIIDGLVVKKETSLSLAS